MEFGELNITASRAFWDDYENIDGDQPTEPIAVQWKWSPNHSIDDFKNLKTFVILEGERIRNQINHQDVIPICQLLHQKVFIYQLKDTTTAFCLSEETNLNSFGVVAESIVDLMNTTASTVDDVNVVTVNVLPISSYKIGVDEKLSGDVIIRGINSGAQTAIPELMEPNILTGISAAVASHRHHSNKSFSSYAIYKDSHKTNFIGSPSVIGFFKLIGVPGNIFYDNYLNDSSLYT